MFKFNYFRGVLALGFSIELGMFCGWNHFADQPAGELIASGISLLLWSLAFEGKK